MFEHSLPSSLSGSNRGNPLAAYHVDSGATAHRLWLSGPVQVADQVTVLAPEYTRVAPTTSEARLWTHVLDAKGPIRQDIVNLLDACQRVVCLPCKGLDVALALDWYKVPQDDVDSHQWPNTAIGELVHRAKYWYAGRPKLQRPIGTKLSDLLAAAVRAHPLVSRAKVVADVPGHSSEEVSLGSKLSASVARRLEVPFVPTRARSKFRLPAKDTPPGERKARLDGEFSVDPSIGGQHVLIVDDVYRSGTSVEAVAAAATAAGARSVCALCPVRTMRS